MSSWIRRLFTRAGVSSHHGSAPVHGSERKGIDIVPSERLPRVTTCGMQLVAMIGDYDRSRLPASNDTIVLLEETGRKVRANCGHWTRASLVFNAYGVKVGGHGKHFCADCAVVELQRVAIRCALCGLPIIPGDSVAVYDCGGADIRKEIAFHLGDGQVLGCLRRDCSIPGAFAGRWGGPERGFICAFP